MRLLNYYMKAIDHTLWVYRGNISLGMFGRTLEKFVNHTPAARDLQTFLVFFQTSRVGYYPYKPIESVVYCLNGNEATSFPGSSILARPREGGKMRDPGNGVVNEA